MMRTGSLAFILTVATGPAQALAPHPSQPAEERVRQRALPQSSDPIWRTLAHTRVTSHVARGLFVAQHPVDVKALDGQEVSVAGFMLATSVIKSFPDFILTRYTPVCAFCPPGAPNEAMQVSLNRFVGQATGQITVRGRLHLEKDGASGLFFGLDQAEIVTGR